MSQRQRFNPINQVPFNGPYAQPYPLPFNYGVPQPYPLNQSFNYLAPQPHLVLQQFHNQSTNNDRSWIDKAFTYRAFTQNQQAPQPNNQQRVPQIQAHYTNYPILNQQAQQHYNQYQVQANYQRDQLTHAPYSRAPFGYTPISANQHPFNYPRGVINPSQAFNARAQSNQQSSTPNDSRNFQPVSIYHNPVYGHQTSFSPGYNQGFVAQRIPIQPYYAQPHAKPYAQNGRQSADSLVRQGYTNKNQSKGKMVPLSNQVNVERMAAEISNQSSKSQIEHEKYIAELEEQSRELEKSKEEYTQTIKQLEANVKEARAIFDANAKTIEALIASTNNPTVVHIQEGVKSTMGFISGDAHSSCQEDRSANNPDVQLYETNKATYQTNQSSTSWPYSAENIDVNIERHVPSSSLNLSYKQVCQLYQAPLRVIGEGKPQEHEDLRRQKPLQTQKPLPTQKTVTGFGRA